MIDDVGTTGEVCVVSLPPMRVACFAAYGPSPEEDAAARLERWLEEQGLSSDARRFGFDVEVPAERAAPGVRGYEAWRPVPPGVGPAGEVSIRDIEGGLYATLRLMRPFAPHADPFERIPAGWLRLRDWVVASRDYRAGEHQWLEELISTPDGDDLVLYHPLAPAEASSGDEGVA